MRSKVGVLVGETQVDLLALNGNAGLDVKDVASFDLKVKNVYNELTLDDEKLLTTQSEVIRKTLESKRITEADACVVVPDEKCSLQVIKLPLVSEKEILSAIELQSEEFVPYPIDKASFDYQILTVDKERNEMYLLLTVALKKMIDQISDLVLSFGVYPNSIEPESTAMFRLLFNSILKINESVIMLINIGDNSTQVSIVNRQQQQLVTTNHLSIGSNFFYKALENNLNIPREAARELFNKFDPANANVQQIVNGSFSEFAKDINRILLSALEKIGSLPKQVFVYSQINDQTYVKLFAANPGTQAYAISSLKQCAMDTTKVKASVELAKRLNQYLITLGAVI